MTTNIKVMLLGLLISSVGALADDPPSTNFNPVDPNPGIKDWSTKVVQDRGGNSYVFGFREKTKGGDDETILEKFDRSGNRTWIKVLASPLNVYNAALVPRGSISNGALFVAGHQGKESRLYAARLDLEGEIVWQAYLPMDGDKQTDMVIAGVTTDPRNSDVYVVGSTFGAIQGFTNIGYKDAFIFKLSANGQILWKQQFGSTEFEFAGGVACDSKGNVYVIGGTEGKIHPENPGKSPRIFLAKYDPNGKLLPMKDAEGKLVNRVREYGEIPLGGYGAAILIKDDVIYIADDTSLDVDVLGHKPLGSYDVIALTLDLDGAIQHTMRMGTDWEDRFSALHSGNNSMAVDDKGRMYLLTHSNKQYPQFNHDWFYRINVFRWLPGEGHFETPADLRVGFQTANTFSLSVEDGRIAIAGSLAPRGEISRFFYQE